MALNLSTLTSPATSGDVLQEVLTTADFLEPCPVLRNLSRGSNKGGDAKQDVALNQPKALPLIKNPSGKLGGYLYIPDVAGNYATGTSVTIGANQTWEGELDMVITQWGTESYKYIVPFGGGGWSSGFGLIFRSDGFFRVFSKGNPTENYLSNSVILGATFNVKYGYNGTEIYADINGVREYTATPNSQSGSITNPLHLAQQNNLTPQGNYAIQKAKLTVNSSVVFDCDFNGSTSIRHGDTKFNCVGGPVTLTRAGLDPAKIIKRPVLRFDGVNDGLHGLFANNINSGYMFAAFSVLGGGGDAAGRVFSVHKTGGYNDYGPTGLLFSAQAGSSSGIMTYNDATLLTHDNLFDDANGDILHDIKALAGNLSSKVNNADLKTSSNTIPDVDSDNFNIGSQRFSNGDNAAIDLEFLALFNPDSIPDEKTAQRIRNYINGRGVHPIFTLIDSAAYYFYDGTKSPVGAISSGSSAWSGRVVGSDNGDSASLLATQATSNDAPVGDGFKVTFADNTDHLDIPLIRQSGYQIVGSSLGTFVYKINGTTAVTELNLLGNLGNASYRKAGDLYGIILLPESATGADIEAARKLLIDRGAAEGFTGSNLYSAWYQRGDIVEFKGVPMPEVTDIRYAFASQTALVSFPAMSFPALILAANAWQGNTIMSDFGAIQAPLGNNFTAAWQSCTALKSFPAGAKLGTEATNVNFFEAWRGSGLLSFSTPLPTGTNFEKSWRESDLIEFKTTDFSAGTRFKSSWQLCDSLNSFGAIQAPNGVTFSEAWRNCSSLTSFPSGAKLGTEAASVSFTSAWQSSGLTSFSTPLPKAKSMYRAFKDCTSLTDFSSDVFANWSPSILNSSIFSGTWEGCNLTPLSVQNIMTSIDSSGKFATTDGTSGGNALGGNRIDIDYNTATGSLSAATNSAVTSLKAKGWSIIVNNVTL